jgi:hypothetical protein
MSVCLKLVMSMLGVVAHNCNPGYKGGRDWKDCGSLPALGKKLARSHLNKEVRCGGMYLWFHLRGRCR